MNKLNTKIFDYIVLAILVVSIIFYISGNSNFIIVTSAFSIIYFYITSKKSKEN